MTCPMERSVTHQRGAALVGVLVLLTVALLLGVSGVHSALLDERLAGNYREATRAGMGAEWAASLGHDRLDASAVFHDAPVERLADVTWVQFTTVNAMSGNCQAGLRCRYGYWWHDGRPHIVAMGAVERQGVVTLTSAPMIVALERAVDEDAEGLVAYRIVGWQ